MPEQRIEYRVADAEGGTLGRFDQPEPAHAFAARLPKLLTHCPGPFRVECRTVTTSEWETVE